MFLAVDIGNTSISLAVSKGQRVLKEWHIDTILDAQKLIPRFSVLIKNMKKRYPAITEVAICSVVPKALSVIEPLLQREIKINSFVIGRDIKVPIVNRYRNPRQVGQDRLVCAYAAKMKYGVPAIVIDLGTAITLDVVSHKGEYLGGVIVPGIRLSAESLFKKTAMLPKIEIKGPAVVIGKTTQESILSGIFFGYGALCRGMVQLISRQLKEKPKIILTGGHASLMRKYIGKDIQLVDKNLVFKGIDLVRKYYR